MVDTIRYTQYFHRFTYENQLATYFRNCNEGIKIPSHQKKQQKLRTDFHGGQVENNYLKLWRPSLDSNPVNEVSCLSSLSKLFRKSTELHS